MSAMDGARQLANDHVEWFLGMLRPLLVDHFIHGFKHGIEYKPLTTIDEDKYKEVMKTLKEGMK